MAESSISVRSRRRCNTCDECHDRFAGVSDVSVRRRDFCPFANDVEAENIIDMEEFVERE